MILFANTPTLAQKFVPLTKSAVPRNLIDLAVAPVSSVSQRHCQTTVLPPVHLAAGQGRYFVLELDRQMAVSLSLFANQRLTLKRDVPTSVRNNAPNSTFTAKVFERTAVDHKNPCCNTEPTCVPNHLFNGCPVQTFDSDGCPIIANQLMCMNRKQCSGGHDNNGCKLRDNCIEPVHDAEIHANCPFYCPAACNLLFETPCPQTYDINGCPEKQTCERFPEQCPKNKHDKVTGCPVRDVIDCGSNGIMCSQGPVKKSELVANGTQLFDPTTICQAPWTCQDVMMTGNKSHCQSHCPELCTYVSSFQTNTINFIL